MKHTRIIRFLGVYLALSVILLFCLTSISAETDYPEQPQVSTQPEISVNDSAVASARSSVSPEIVSGAIYALLNTGTNKWASTAHTASTVDSLNVFQYSQWSNSAQTFRFVKVSPTDNTYVIYPLEYNGRNQNANYTKALWCDCSAMASNPQTINVTLADYNSSDDGFKWTIEYVTMGFIIRLKNYPNYCLFPVDNTVGSPTATGISDNGNIVVRYVSPAQLIPSSYSIWELKYVIPNGTYYIKNRGGGTYLQASLSTGGKVLLNNDSRSDYQKWSISHISNGRYFITSIGSAGAMALASRTPVDGDFVYVEGNMAQPRFWWNIERTASGSFKIQCATAEDYEYALKDGETIAGHHYVANGEYWDDLDYSDEWYISNNKYTYYTAHYYDQGFVTRHTTESMSALEQIQEYQAYVYDILFELFSLKTISTYTEMENSAADDCKVGVDGEISFDDLDNLCNHNYDHLSRNNNVAGIENGTETSTSIMWTGHIMFDRRSDENGNYVLDSNGDYIINRAPPSGSYYNLKKIIITPSQTVTWIDNGTQGAIDDEDEFIPNAPNEVNWQNTFDLLHEISHQLGALDHYCYDPYNTAGCSNPMCYKCNLTPEGDGKCAMNQRLDVTAEDDVQDIFCEHCIDMIYDHLSDHHQIN